MTPMRRRPGLSGPDMPTMGTPAPMQFAPPPPMLDAPDASGAQAIGGLANMALAMQSKLSGGPQPLGGAGGALSGMMGDGPTDAPARRKTPFIQAAGGPNYA